MAYLGPNPALASVFGAPVAGTTNRTFADNLLRDMSGMVTGFFPAMAHLGAGAIGDVGRAVGLVGGDYATPQNLYDIAQGFQQTSPLIPLVQGDIAGAGHRLYEYPVSGSLDLFAPISSGYSQAGRLGRSMAGKGLLSQPAADRVFRMGGYERLTDPGTLARFDEMPLNQSLLQSTPQDTLFTSARGEVPAHEFTQAVPAGDDMYLRRTHRTIRPSEKVRWGEPRGEMELKLQEQVRDSMLGRQVRSRNELIAKLGDRWRVFVEHNVPDSSMFGSHRIARHLLRSGFRASQSEQDRMYTEHAAAERDLFGSLGKDDQEIRDIVGYATQLDHMGFTPDTAIDGLSLLRARNELPELQPTTPINLQDIYDQLSQTKYLTDDNMTAADKFMTWFGHRRGPEGMEWQVPFSEYRDIIKAAVPTQPVEGFWDSRVGHILRSPRQWQAPSVRTSSKFAGNIKDEIHSLATGLHKDLREQNYAWNLARKNDKLGTVHPVDSLAHDVINENRMEVARDPRATILDNNLEAITDQLPIDDLVRQTLGATDLRNGVLNIGSRKNAKHDALPQPLDAETMVDWMHPTERWMPEESQAFLPTVQNARWTIGNFVKTFGSVAYHAVDDTQFENARKGTLRRRMKRIMGDVAQDKWDHRINTLRDLARSRNVEGKAEFDNPLQMTNAELHDAGVYLASKVDDSTRHQLQKDLGIDPAEFDNAIKILRNDEEVANRSVAHYDQAGSRGRVADETLIAHHPWSEAAADAHRRFYESWNDLRPDLAEHIKTTMDQQYTIVSNQLKAMRERGSGPMEFANTREHAYNKARRIDLEKLNAGDEMPFEGIEPGIVQWLRRMDEKLPQILETWNNPAFQRWMEFRKRQSGEVQTVAESLYSDWMTPHEIDRNRARLLRWAAGINNRIEPTSDGLTRVPDMDDLQMRLDEVADELGMNRVQLDPDRMRFVPMRSRRGEESIDYSLDRRTADNPLDVTIREPSVGDPFYQFMHGHFSEDPSVYIDDAMHNMREEMHRSLAEQVEGIALKITPGQAQAWLTGKNPKGESIDPSDLRMRNLVAPADATDAKSLRKPFVIIGSNDPMYRHMALQSNFMQQYADNLRQEGAHAAARIIEQSAEDLGLPGGIEDAGSKTIQQITSKKLDAVRKRQGAESKVYVVPRTFYDALETEVSRSNGAIYTMLKQGGDFWKTTVLHWRFPTWFRNNIVGSAMLLVMASDPQAAVKALSRTSKTMVKLLDRPGGKEWLATLEQSLAQVATGTGSSHLMRMRAGKKMDGVMGRYWRLMNQLGDLNAKVADQPWRLARADQIIGELADRMLTENPKLKSKSRDTLYRELLSDPAVRRHVTERTLGDMIDFSNLGRFERDYISLMFPFYSWLKGSMGVGARFLMGRPLRAAGMAQISETGDEWLEEEYGEFVPEYLRSNYLLPDELQGGMPGDLMIGMGGLNPLESPVDTLQMGANLLPWPRSMGGPSYHETGPENIMNAMHPLFRAGVAGVTGSDPFFGTPVSGNHNAGVEALEQLAQVPPVKLVQDIAKPQSPRSIAVDSTPLQLANYFGTGLRGIQPGPMLIRGQEEYLENYGVL